jgi:hypothetical protein
MPERVEYMKANELRTGNWILNKQYTGIAPVFTVFGVTEDKVLIYPQSEEYKDEWISISEFAPIPLTEEWLLNFGFKKEDKRPSKTHGQYFSKWLLDLKYSFAYAGFREDWGFYHSYTDAMDDSENDRYDFISCGIRYVHQLQNLYFSLTGEELTIKQDSFKSH